MLANMPKKTVLAAYTRLTKKYLIRQRNLHRFLHCTRVGLYSKIEMEPYFETFGIWSRVVAIRTSRCNPKEICILSTKCNFAFLTILVINSIYLSPTLLLFLPVTWLRPLDSRLCPGRAGFGPRQVHIRLLLDKMALEQVFLRILRLSTINIILPVLHTFSYLSPTLHDISNWQCRLIIHFLPSLLRLIFVIKKQSVYFGI